MASDVYIDCDHLPTGPRICDLGKYLVSRLDAHIDHGGPEAMVAMLRQYVAGYHAAHPLSERELAAVVPMMLTLVIGSADWHRHGWVPDPAGYQRDRRAVEWLVPRYDELVSAAIPG